MRNKEQRGQKIKLQNIRFNLKCINKYTKCK